MTVGFGHRYSKTARPEKGLAAVLQDADGAMLANQNFDDIKAEVRGAADFAQPSLRRAS
jgi:hypothetical protein